MENYICIHAHFYQPPRENPWLEVIERQESARPYHDWNQKIAAECYLPNGIARLLDKSGRIDRVINNYAHISFNFGPTLLSWLAAAEPAAYRRILEADRESAERFSGHGSAIAQAYSHAILPLCNPRDKWTQIAWGMRDFVFRFGRQPEGMWLPETAVDLETLDLMAQAGLKFAILAPHQAKKIRRRGERSWHSVHAETLDTRVPYEIHLPTGRKLALFFYNGPIALAVGFQKLLSDGGEFVRRLMEGFPPDRKEPALVHIAVDGETFGHHHHFGDMALAYALDAIEKGKRARLTNYGEFLEKHPPTHLADIWENSSWSCPHETGRWKEHCGCHTGAHPEWQQQWRSPLRKALDWLRDHLENLYDDEAATLLRDPWNARNDYIDVILDRSPESHERFLSKHRVRPLSPEENTRVFKLLELQRCAMLMYTSCGWFFDDLSGIETVQILKYAGRAIALGRELFPGTGADDLEAPFLEILEKAKSNLPEMGNGRDLYAKSVKAAEVRPSRAAAHYAARSLFQDYPDSMDLYSYTIERREARRSACGNSRLVLGRCRLVSMQTLEDTDLEFAVLFFGGHALKGGVRSASDMGIEAADLQELRREFEKADLTAALRILDEGFPGALFSLKSLVADEQLRLLNLILESIHTGLEDLNSQAYECMAPLIRSMSDLSIESPAHFLYLADRVIHTRLVRALRKEVPDWSSIESLLRDAVEWNIKLDAEALGGALRSTIETLAHRAFDHPGDLDALNRIIAALRIAANTPFTVNLYRTQNIYLDLRKSRYSGIRTIAERGDKNAAAWIDAFGELGRMLSINPPQN